ncbi:NAD(P)/FAD-dependent oxidoreductase [Gracilimonas mengyeensis]|uniref:NADH:ubiquinone reductase (non-electrogenic) n=1 Tax=Gracilimonas mengyeensis TaxID=1302730 RepID=A0A521EHV3_9BACT|nr:NAD(P)/FAD-dependent oxidoreductase [Gracilimonas mengyeensis]SMO83051.1 NADH dehydrogenase [Gracilimonas mengyeensis]
MAKKVVIVGGGFAGISAAKKLADTDYEVVIVDKSNHHLFQPLLYQVATAALSPGDIATPIRAIFSKKDNIRVLLGEVTGVNKQENTLSLKDGTTLDFDFLVLAPGARYNYFGNKDWEKHAPGLKSLNDALDIRERILLSLEKAEQITDPQKRKPYLTYVVIGGGPTGVEMAGSIAEIAKRNMMRDYRNFKKGETQIHLVEAAPGILNGFDEPLPEKGHATLEKMGVNVLLNSPVQEIKENGVQLSDRFIETPNIIWAAGVSASPMLETLNAETDRGGRVKVNPDLSLPDHSNIFVLGDAAYLEDKNGKPLPGLAPVAMQQGRFLGDLLRNPQKLKERPPFHYTDKGSMATIGRAKAVADVRGFKFSGFFAWLLWGFIHIFFLIGFRNRFRVFAEWMWHYLTFKRGVRLIKSDAKED